MGPLPDAPPSGLLGAAGADTAGNDAALTLFAVVVLAICALYLAPTIVAAIRQVPNVGSVAAINLLLGWSLVGWAVSWALALRSRPRAVVVQVAAIPGPPPGWYPDPWDTSRLRRWNGSGWTDAVGNPPPPPA